MELLERGDELAALGSWLGEAGAGAGRFVLVSGEAGIGKTSLVRGFCDQHAQGARVWWGACDALTTPRPLGPLYDIARVTRGELAALLVSDVSRHERFSGFLDALKWPLQPVGRSRRGSLTHRRPSLRWSVQRSSSRGASAEVADRRAGVLGVAGGET